MMFQLVLIRMLPDWKYSGAMQKEIVKIEAAVLYANSIRDLGWLDGIGERYVSERDHPDTLGGDKYLYPKQWWKDLPPCPLTIV